MKSLIVFILIMLGLFGCAGVPLSHDQCNATLFPTAHEHEACLKAAKDYEQAEHEKADKRLVARDRLIIFLNGCDADGRFVVMEKRSGRSKLPNSRQQAKAKREYGRPYTHDNVHPQAKSWDFQCWDRWALAEAIRRLNGGF